MSTPVIGSATQTSSAATNPQAATRTTATRDLGQDAFLKLLTTQLQNQDPTKPQDNGEFIQQLATFSSLEKLTAISTKLDQIGSALGVVLTDSPGSNVSGGSTSAASSPTSPASAGTSSTTSNGGK